MADSASHRTPQDLAVRYQRKVTINLANEKDVCAIAADIAHNGLTSVYPLVRDHASRPLEALEEKFRSQAGFWVWVRKFRCLTLQDAAAFCSVQQAVAAAHRTVAAAAAISAPVPAAAAVKKQKREYVPRPYDFDSIADYEAWANVQDHQTEPDEYLIRGYNDE